MKVSYKNNVLTVVTDISKATIEKGVASLRAKDEKGNEVFGVSISVCGEARINEHSITCNAFVDGKAAVVAVMPMDCTLDDVQRMYGKALVAANKYTAQIAAQACAEEETIAALFTSDATSNGPSYHTEYADACPTCSPAESSH